MASGSFWGDIGEFLGFNNPYSSAGKERTAAERNYAFNSAEAERSREWEKMMSDTAVRRRAADMQAAGINPMLAAGSAATAGTSVASSGAKASQSSARNISGVLNTVVTSALKIASNAQKKNSSSTISTAFKLLSLLKP